MNDKPDIVRQSSLGVSEKLRKVERFSRGRLKKVERFCRVRLRKIERFCSVRHRKIRAWQSLWQKGWKILQNQTPKGWNILQSQTPKDWKILQSQTPKCWEILQRQTQTKRWPSRFAPPPNNWKSLRSKRRRLRDSTTAYMYKLLLTKNNECDWKAKVQNLYPETKFVC